MRGEFVQHGFHLLRWFTPSQIEPAGESFTVGRRRIYPLLMLLFGLGNTIFSVIFNGWIGVMTGFCYLAMTYVSLFFIDYEDHESGWVGYPVLLFKWATLVMVAGNFFLSFWVLNESHRLEMEAEDYKTDYATWKTEDDQYQIRLDNWNLGQRADLGLALKISENQKDTAKANQKATANAVRLHNQTGQAVHVAVSSSPQDFPLVALKSATDELGVRKAAPAKPAETSSAFLGGWKWKGVKLAMWEVGFVFIGLLWLGLGAKIHNGVNGRKRSAQVSNETGKPETLETAPLPVVEKIDSPSLSEMANESVLEAEKHPFEGTQEIGEEGSTQAPNDAPKRPPSGVTQEHPTDEEEAKNPIDCYEGTYHICNGRYRLRKRKGSGWDMRYGGTPPEGEKVDIGYVTNPKGIALVEAKGDDQQRLADEILREKGKIRTNLRIAGK